MPFLCIIFALISTAHSMEFSRYTKSSENNLLQKFFLTSEKVIFEKRTNYYDQKKDWRVGVMYPINKKVQADGVSGLLERIRDIDYYLRKKQMTFNQLTGDPLHAAHWILDEFRIKDNSILHPELMKSFEGLREGPWKLKDGVELSADGKMMRTVVNGKVGSFVFIPDANCKRLDSVRVCRFYPHGVLYVR